jgi:endonuclease/exonuclease/phosphatase family metal-dependent hydrolase
MIKTVIVIAFGFLLMSHPAQSDTIRIGSWNIQDLHHLEGHSLRAFDDFYSVKRRSKDFEILRKYRDQFGSNATPADVLALQEIGTKAALTRLFPPVEYDTLMSNRWSNDSAPEGKGDVFTAIAIRKASGIKIIARADLPELAIMHSDGHSTRAATGALLEINGKQLWFLSVHFKSSCATTEAVHTSTKDACNTLWRQALILKNWIKTKRASGTPIIIAGDFNRRFRQFQDQGPMWKALNGVDPTDDIVTPWLVKHPISITRKCPTRKGRSTQPIDWIVLTLTPLANVKTSNHHGTGRNMGS